MIKEEIYILINLIAYSITFLALWDFTLEFKNLLVKKRFLKIIIDVIFLVLTVSFTYQYTYKLSSGYIPLLFFIFLLLGFLIYFLLLRYSYLLFVNNILKILNKWKPILLVFLKELVYNRELIIFLNNEIKRLNKAFKGNKN